MFHIINSSLLVIFFFTESCCFINELLLFCKDLSFARVTFYLTLFRLGYFGTIRLEGGTLCPPPFLLYLLPNYHQTWHASTMAQDLSKAVIVKSIVTSL